MKMHKISRAVIAAFSIASALAFSACEAKPESRGLMPDDREEEADPTAVPTKPAEEPTPAPEGPAEDENIPLTSEEIKQINSDTAIKYNGFFTCSYCCPEMIDWGNVCYDGAGISKELTEKQLEKYLGGRELYTGLTAVYHKDLEDYCLSTTGTDYITALRELGWQYIFDGDDIIYVHEHGDTNYIPVNVTDGYKEGDTWHLFYRIYDTYYAEDRDFEMTARVTDDGGKWNFISNMPYDEPTQSELLDIDFYPDDTNASLNEMIYVTGHPGDEPVWYWANITAKEDNTLVVIDHTADASDTEEELVWSGIFLPGERIYSTTLNKGESFAIRVNLAWSPDMHLAASRDGFESEYWFGQDNWRHDEKDDGTPASRKIIGYDRDAMGCGLNPQNNIQFYNMLNGGWLAYDNDGQVAGYLMFSGYGSDLRISCFDDSLQTFINVINVNSSGAVGDGISVECTDEELARLNLDSASIYSKSSYEIKLSRLSDCQCLELIPLEEQDDIVGMMLSYPDKERIPLVFYRYNICAE